MMEEILAVCSNVVVESVKALDSSFLSSCAIALNIASPTSFDAI